MKYIDKIYGEVEIDEPVILELMACPAMQRLRYIDMAGYRPLFVNPDVAASDEDNSRYVHSIGVYFLLKKYGASLEEQIAGLIHDVSHSAFSHCIDYVLSAGSESEHDLQDNIFESFIKKTEIPEIISRHGLNLERILDDNNWPLKENNLPDLCADRIDYIAHNAVFHEVVGAEEMRDILVDLTAENGRWIFKTAAGARRFAELFHRMNTIHYSGFESALMFRTVGDFLKHALAQGYIDEKSLYTTDKEVIAKIIPFCAEDKQLKIYWDRMNDKNCAVNDPENFEAKVVCKSRAVDPLCYDGGEVKRMSDVYPEWKEILARESKPKEYFLRFVG